MEILPQVTRTWYKLPKEDKQSLGSVNEFFCGLAFWWDQQTKRKLVLNFGKMFCLRVKILAPWFMEVIAMANL